MGGLLAEVLARAEEEPETTAARPPDAIPFAGTTRIRFDGCHLSRR